MTDLVESGHETDHRGDRDSAPASNGYGMQLGVTAPEAPEVTWESLQADCLPRLQQNASSTLICGFQRGVADCLDQVHADLNALDSAATEHLGAEAT